MAKHDPAMEALAASAAEYIQKHHYKTDWFLVGAAFGLRELVREHTRLYKAQSFGDDDYGSAIAHFLEDVAATQPGALHPMLVKIIGKGGIPEDEKVDYPVLDAYLTQGGGAPALTMTVPALPATVKYIDIAAWPDDFYKDLADQINKCYRVGLFPAQAILMRKLMENLLIDLLRRKYGMKQVNLFYDPARGRFLDFSALVANLKPRLGDFAGVAASFDSSFVAQVEKFRETGNASAHSIDVNLKKETLDKLQADFNHAAKLLVSVYQKTPIAA